MSVDYRSVVYYGWVVNSDEISQLDDDVYENLMDSGTLMLQNSWTGDSLYAYVLCNACVEANDEAIISLSDIAWPEPVDAPASVAQFYKLFPQRINEQPKLMLMMQVY